MRSVAGIPGLQAGEDVKSSSWAVLVSRLSTGLLSFLQQASSSFMRV